MDFAQLAGSGASPGDGDVGTAPWLEDLDAAYGDRVPLLVSVVQGLSLQNDLPGIMALVRGAARRLTGSDGATFVLREGDLCHYADEEAIAPLWKGMRFPLSACVSGWAMQHRAAAVIPDVYADPRVPADAYRPTFVRSLVMVPIRRRAPLGAIGVYWAEPHHPTRTEVAVLQALADGTSIAMENVRIRAELEQRVRERTRELEEANRELEAFSRTVAHDLRGPLTGLRGYSMLLLEQLGPSLDARHAGSLRSIDLLAKRMGSLIDDLLRFAQVGRRPLAKSDTDLSALAQLVAEVAVRSAGGTARVEVAPGMRATCDAALLRVVLENLLGNAVKYASRVPAPRIRVFERDVEGTRRFCVHDNGAGFPPERAAELFQPFKRLHTQDEFEGTGLGLATVARIVERHGGAVWAEGRPGQGATFSFALGG